MTTKGKKTRQLEILKDFYSRGMTGRKSGLVEEAAKLAGCSEKTVITFIYNQNKKRRVTTDVKLLDFPEKIGSFQTFQRGYARNCKLYGRKYSNKDAAQMWRGCDSTMKKESFINVSMKGNTFLSKYEPKVKYFVNDLKQVNALTLYARQTPCGKQLIVSNSILLPRVKKFLLESSNYLASVRRILKKMTEEDDEYISTVLTGHSKIRNIRKISRKELQKEEKQILQELLQADLFDKAAKPKICRLIK